ncbi:MAG: hypothetical protein WA364_02725 [Candidatus Nitrosopolaris sp.]
MKGKIRMSKARLSEKAKKNLKRNTREKGNRFIKMQPNEKLEFNPEKIGLVKEVYNLDTGKSETVLLDLESIRKVERALDKLINLAVGIRCWIYGL